MKICFIIFYLQKELCKYISFFISGEKYHTNQQLVLYQLLVGVKLPNIKKNGGKLALTFYLSVMNLEMESARIGEKIRKIREFKGLKQGNIAEKMGMTVNGYGKIERGETTISIERLEQISNALGITVLELLHFDEKVVFNIQNMDHSAPNGIVHNYPVSKIERELFLQQIKSLRETIDTQKQLIQELRKKH